MLYLCTYIYTLSMYPIKFVGHVLYLCTWEYMEEHPYHQISKSPVCVNKYVKRDRFSLKRALYSTKRALPPWCPKIGKPQAMWQDSFICVTWLIHNVPWPIHMFGMTRIIEDRNHLWCTYAHVLFWEKIAFFWYINFLLTLSLCERREFHPRCEKSHSGRQRAERLPTF